MCDFLQEKCRGRESNPHAPFGTQDFKSCASASSATPACENYPGISLIVLGMCVCLQPLSPRFVPVSQISRLSIWLTGNYQSTCVHRTLTFVSSSLAPAIPMISDRPFQVVGHLSTGSCAVRQGTGPARESPEMVNARAKPTGRDLHDCDELLALHHGQNARGIWRRDNPDPFAREIGAFLGRNRRDCEKDPGESCTPTTEHRSVRHRSRAGGAPDESFPLGVPYGWRANNSKCRSSVERTTSL